MLTGKYLDTVEGNECLILSKDATRITHQSSTCIDHMVLRNIEKYEFTVMQECFSDKYFCHYHPIRNQSQKSERVFYRKTVLLKNPKKPGKLKSLFLFFWMT